MLRRRKRAHFLHVGKTGGSAITAALGPHKRHGCYDLKLHGHGPTLADIPVGEKVFFAVRDPTTRFVSGFYSRLRKGQPRFLFEWTEEEAAAFARFRTPNELAEALSAEEPGLRVAAEEAMSSIRHVADPHTRWFDEAKLHERHDDVLCVLFQDRLADDFAVLVERLGLTKERPMLPMDEVQAHRTPEHADRSLSALAQRNLRSWYARDYELLRFVAETWQRA